MLTAHKLQQMNKDLKRVIPDTENHLVATRANLRIGRKSLLAFLLIALSLCSREVAHSQRLSGEWSIPSDISYPITTGDDRFGVLLCDSHQNLHVLWTKSSEGGSGIYYRTDMAGEWTLPIDVIAVPDPLAVELSVAISPHDNVIHVTWQDHWVRGDCYHSQAPLLDAGSARAWSPPQIIVQQPDGASIHIDRKGIVRVVYGASDDTSFESGVYYLESVDGGGTWSDPVAVYRTFTPTPSVSWGQLKMDAAGRMHMAVTVRSQEYGAFSELVYLRSTDGGENWQSETVAGPATTAPGVAGLALFVFGEDEIHRTWHAPERLHQWSLDGGETWSPPIEIMSIGWGFGGANLLAKDSAGVLHVVTSVGNGVFSADFDGLQWDNPKQLENRVMDPHSQRMVVCRGNELHVVYDDRYEDDTTVWYSNRRVDAPHIDQEPIPPPVPQSVTDPDKANDQTSLSAIAPLAAYQGEIDSFHTQLTSEVHPTSPLGFLLIPTGAAVLLVGAVLGLVIIARLRR